MPVLNVRNKETMLISVLDALQKNAGISSVSPGSIARAFAEAITTEISDLYSAFKLSVEQSSLSMASGRNLDAIGELYGVSRRSITEEIVVDRITANIEFVLDKPYVSAITIPKGTLVYNSVDGFNDTQHSYELNDDVVIQAGLSRAYGSVSAKFPSNSITAARNTLVKHSYIGPPGVLVYCTNPKEVYASINSESDDNYRKRIVSAIRGSATGTAESIRFAALAVKGVKDAKIREGSYGIGSCDVLIVPEGLSPMASLPEVVSTAIATVKPLGIRLNVRMAKRKSVDLTATLTLREGTTADTARTVEAQARIFLNRYLNSFTIGSSVSIQEMEAQMKYASDTIVGVTINNLSVDRKSIPNTDYRLSDDRSYMGAGTVSIFSVIIGSSNY
jgi:uncharacterized phage protein gp47/JayE